MALAFIAFSIGSEFNFGQVRKWVSQINIITIFEVIFAILGVFLILFFIPKPAPIMPDGYNPLVKEMLLLD